MMSPLSVASPTPLSPDQFGTPSGQPTTPAQPGAVAGLEFSATDRATFKRVLDGIKAARAEARSSDKKVAHDATRRLVALIGYLIGFFDSRGMVPESTVEPGFGLLFGEAARPDRETALDELERSLESVLDDQATRDINWKHVAGAVLEGAAMAIIALVVL